MTNIFIIGSQGYDKNYGGWETFVKNLVNNYNDEQTTFYVSEITNVKNKETYTKGNVICNPIYTKIKGAPRMFIYTIKAFYYYLKYVKKNKINNPYFYILGLKLGPLLWLHHFSLKRKGIKVYLNPDGLEWRRSKWNFVIKQCFKLSEWSMVRHADLIVCDSKGIEEYIKKTYKHLKTPTTYIAYGANKIELLKKEEDVLAKYKLKKDEYFLIVGRFVPENNYELILTEFMKSKTKKKLIIVTNVEKNKFYQDLLEKTKFDQDKRITFLGSIYDQTILSTIRKNAFAYIHGHSVGGTNPSLLEAMNTTDLNILYDVNFNREVGENSCLYFRDKNSLTNILNDTNYLNNCKKALGPKAKKRIKCNFTWDFIVKEYKDIFK